jgi:hypothetical protein
VNRPGDTSVLSYTEALLWVITGTAAGEAGQRFSGGRTFTATPTGMHRQQRLRRFVRGVACGPHHRADIQAPVALIGKNRDRVRGSYRRMPYLSQYAVCTPYVSWLIYCANARPDARSFDLAARFSAGTFTPVLSICNGT